ncbi:hypothetical protein K1719_010131 [Acacia pycnantha]|nr:hypothetical protein K1719_010131 [Acacia pycnantha]
MLYYKDDAELTNCKFCEHDRYKVVRVGRKMTRQALRKMWYFPLVPRLQRLYSSEQTAAHMRWHHEHRREEKFVAHPSDAEAWLKFDESNPSWSIFGWVRSVQQYAQDLFLLACDSDSVQPPTFHVHEKRVFVPERVNPWAVQPKKEDRCVPQAFDR